MVIGAGVSELSGIVALSPSRKDSLEFAIDLLLELEDDSDASNRIIDAKTHAMTSGCGRKNVRRTYRGRLRHMDEYIRQLLCMYFGKEAQIRLHDAGASNAITSAELFEALGDFPRLKLHASDYATFMSVVQLRNCWRVIFDQFGQPLQIVGPGVVLRYPTRKSQKNWLLWLKTNWMALRLLPAARRALLETGSGAVRRIDLFHPAARALAETEPRFTLGRCDMIVMEPDSADVIRVMNVVFKWEESERRRLYQVLHRALPEGGILVVGLAWSGNALMDTGTQHLQFSAFRKTGNGFLEVMAVGGGYETDLISMLDFVRAPGSSSDR